MVTQLSLKQQASEAVVPGSNPGTPTKNYLIVSMFNLDDIKETLNELREKFEIEDIKNDILPGAIMMVKIIRQVCKERNLLNEQEFLNWEDELNRISIMSPEEDLLEEILKS